jgi:hypothetical protein
MPQADRGVNQGDRDGDSRQFFFGSDAGIASSSAVSARPTAPRPSRRRQHRFIRPRGIAARQDDDKPKRNEPMPATGGTPGLKSRLWEELALKAELITGGVAITPQALALAAPGVRSQEQVHSLFEMDFDTHDFELPSGYTLPNGLSAPFRWNKRSSNVITADGDRTILLRDGHAHGEVTFHQRPGYYGKLTSDGQAMATVAVLARHRALFVAYSNECSYKEKGEDCLFCNINHTKDVYGERGGIFWKTAQQIGETAAEAFREGIIDHVTISGGVIPERRELEYYNDVAEAIQRHSGREDFNGTAVVAAPLDLRHIDRFKEAGFRTTAMNIELWDTGFLRDHLPGQGAWQRRLGPLARRAGIRRHGVRPRPRAIQHRRRDRAEEEDLGRAAVPGVERRDRHVLDLVPESWVGAGRTPRTGTGLVSGSRGKACHRLETGRLHLPAGVRRQRRLRQLAA